MRKMDENPRLGDIRRVSEEYYHKYGRAVSFRKALQRCMKNPGIHRESFLCTRQEELLTDEEFQKWIDNITVFHTDAILGNLQSENIPGRAAFCIQEEDIVDTPDDITVYIHMPYVDDGFHLHDHFEINYVYKGAGSLCFQKEADTKIHIKEGELCFLAPDIPHNFRADPQSIIISIMLRKTTLLSAFASIMKREDTISDFFKSCIYKNKYPGYFIVATDNSARIRRYMQQIIFEFYQMDSYRNTNTISVLSMFFSHIMRCSREYEVFYDSSGAEGPGERFTYMLVMQYIYQNYAEVTLEKLSEVFNYSSSFLSKMIRRCSGKNFSKIIQECRLERGKELLGSSDIGLDEISSTIGYASASHFSRIFKKRYGVSPSDYRKIRASGQTSPAETHCYTGSP